MKRHLTREERASIERALRHSTKLVGPMLSESQQAALDAVKFCLANGTQPFRIDVQILVDLIDEMGPRHPYGDAV